MDWQLIFSIVSFVLNGLVAIITTLLIIIFKGAQKQFEDHKKDDEITKTRLHDLELAVIGKSVTREELKIAVDHLSESIKDGSKQLWDKIDSFEKVIYSTSAAERRSRATDFKS